MRKSEAKRRGEWGLGLESEERWCGECRGTFDLERRWARERSERHECLISARSLRCDCHEGSCEIMEEEEEEGEPSKTSVGEVDGETMEGRRRRLRVLERH